MLTVIFFVFSFHLVARAKACVSDFRAALQNEKSAYGIYKSKVAFEFSVSIVSLTGK